MGFELPVGASRTNEKRVRDFSIIIAHRGDSLGLWATIHSCEIDLANSGFDYEYVLVNNGQKQDGALKSVLLYLQKLDRIGDFISQEEPLAPPSARQLGTAAASGRIFFFFDNHILVDRDYFRHAMGAFAKYDMDMLHSVTRFYSGEKKHHEYELRLEKNFWGQSKFEPMTSDGMPYRVAVGGHGGFAVRADVWREVGGYGPVGLYQGYGGEEMYFDLKMWMLGKSNWLHPQVTHWHYAGQRPYARHYTEDYFRNMMMTANIIGGKDWMLKVHDSFTKYPRAFSLDTTMYDLMLQAEERSRSHARWLEQRRRFSLDELVAWFHTENISH